ncbi:MAG TPA: hypothetical protein VGN26_06220 [Armatimonadota bacterium]|jgi:hypothetical protein
MRASIWAILLTLAAPAVAQTASSRVPAPAGSTVIVSTFEGNRGPGWKQTADISGAVGPKHAVSLDAGGFTVFDKATGKALRHLSPREFWHGVEPTNSLDPRTDPNDPKIIYDPLSQRWFATCAGNAGAADSFLAVSSGPDPTQPWKGVMLPVPKGDPGMVLGVDKNGLYICSHNGSPSSADAMNCLVIPKADAIAPGGPVLASARTFPKLTFAAYPAMDLDPGKPADAPAVILNNEFEADTPGCGKLYLYRVTWAGRKASISGAQVIKLSKVYHTSRQMDCLQPGPGPRLRSDSGRRTSSVVACRGSVFGCHSAKLRPESRVGIVWYEVRVRDGALLQEGFIDDPKRDYLYPSLALDSQGNLGLGCTRTSETEFPSVCVMMRAAGDPPGILRPPVVAVRGTTSYRYPGVAAANWSHYSSTVPDPSDPGLLWTYQAYSNSEVEKQWCAAWASFRLGQQP